MTLWQRFKAWRIKRAWRQRFPDPLVVCSRAQAGECTHVDSMVCRPHDCELRIAHERGEL